MKPVLATIAVLIAACGNDAQGTRAPLDRIAVDRQTAAGVAAGKRELSASGRAAIERGNAAFRDKRYEEALTNYRQAATDAPSNPAPLFGIQMAARAVGNRALADSAALRLRALARPTPDDPHARPPDHPQVKVSEDVDRKAPS
jgi:hypothetical protein